MPDIEKIEETMLRVFNEACTGGQKPTLVWTPERGIVDVSPAQNSEGQKR